MVAKKTKYKNKKAHHDYNNERYFFDSIAERDYFIKLIERAEEGEIKKLKLQPSFIVADAYKISTTKTKSGKSKIGTLKYTPDFEYIENGRKVVVEVKGMKTTAYILRFKLFLALAYRKYRVDTFIEVVKGKETYYECRSVKEIK